jgi:hypothetical protein
VPAALLGEQDHRLLHGRVGRDRDDVRRHDVGHPRGLRVDSVADYPAKDVALGEYPHDAARVDDDHAADPVLVHLGHGVGDCDRRGHGVHY